VAGGDEGDFVFARIKRGGKADWVASLGMNYVRIETAKDFFHLWIGGRRNPKTAPIEHLGHFSAEKFFLFGDFVDLVGINRETD